MMTTWMPGYYNSLVKGYSSQHAQTIGPLGSFWSFGSQLGIMIFMGFLGLIPGPGPAIGSGCCARRGCCLWRRAHGRHRCQSVANYE